jgi:serine/threonine protein kinase
VSDVPPGLSEALAQRYAMERVLGKGGMATVYLAHDRKHDRAVAIKVFRPDLAASIGAERFLNEIQIAARLTHPHILPLHDSGEAEGFLYYVMPYIDGPSLRQRLEQEGRFRPPDALTIAARVADALGYAHRMGFFHRDIKPENILFSQGHPIVADFGIAKAISTAGGANLTRTGFPLGTPGYMSPEQAAGLTDLDGRTDVYGLAVLTYEMLVGEVPGRWPSEEAVRTGRFLEASATHKARLTQVGPQIEAALVRGLAVRHEQRTATPADLIDGLRGAAPPRRRYSEGEVREIVNRAAELEASNPTASGAMTIGGVEAVAGEVGIPPALVRRAADAVTPHGAPGPNVPLPATTPNRWIGGPTRLLYERVVDGEVPESEFPLIVEEIRRALGVVGQVDQLGRSISWTGKRGGREMEVAVSVRAGRTRIVVQENLSNLIGGIFGGIGGGMGGGGMGMIMGVLVGALGISEAVAPIIIPFWLATTYAVARTSYRYASRRRGRELEWLADRLASLALELGEEEPALRAPERKLIK